MIIALPLTSPRFDHISPSPSLPLTLCTPAHWPLNTSKVPQTGLCTCCFHSPPALPQHLHGSAPHFLHSLRVSVRVVSICLSKALFPGRLPKDSSVLDTFCLPSRLCFTPEHLLLCYKYIHVINFIFSLFCVWSPSRLLRTDSASLFCSLLY